MTPNADTAGQAEWTAEAARLICEDGYADYRRARLKAAENLGLRRRLPGPDPARIEAAVLERQRLFGGRAYAARLDAMRRAALQGMRLLAAFQPRLAGSAVSGAIGAGHRVQLHVIADQPESVEMLLHDRRIPFEQDERRYHLADGRQADIPLLRFEAGDLGVDIAVFAPGSERHPPLSQIDNKPARRLGPEQVQSLVGEAAG